MPKQALQKATLAPPAPHLLKRENVIYKWSWMFSAGIEWSPLIAMCPLLLNSSHLISLHIEQCCQSIYPNFYSAQPSVVASCPCMNSLTITSFCYYINFISIIIICMFINWLLGCLYFTLLLYQIQIYFH